ncbi:MAG: ABC transporter permease [Herpetosiphonaceae bacterium]|nr:ABC transporter permease [Herpetosiphonaceae bacterium]
MVNSFLRTVWAITKKDLKIWQRNRASAMATILPPLAFLLVQALGAAAVGRSPVALVVQDRGVEGAKIAAAIRSADVFRLHEVEAPQAAALLRDLQVVAIITVPPDFTTRVATHVQAPVTVQVNNLNLDFTNDIRRAVPTAITEFYQAQGAASPIQVTIQEHDLRQRDVEFFQFSVLPTLVLLLTISGVLTTGLAAAREWETRTIKELLLAPVPAGAVIAGKVLAGFVVSFALGLLVLALGAALNWIRPVGIYWGTAVFVIALVALFSAGLGVALGALLQRIQPVIGVSITTSLYLYFLAGGTAVLAFEPEWLQHIAAFVPLTYGDHALQMAVFYSSADQLGRDTAVLALSALVTIGAGIIAMRRGIARA